MGLAELIHGDYFPNAGLRIDSHAERAFQFANPEEFHNYLLAIQTNACRI